MDIIFGLLFWFGVPIGLVLVGAVTIALVARRLRENRWLWLVVPPAVATVAFGAFLVYAIAGFVQDPCGAARQRGTHTVMCPSLEE